MKVKDAKDTITKLEHLMKDFEKVNKACVASPSIEKSVEDYSGIDSLAALLIDTVNELTDYKNMLTNAIDNAVIKLN